MAGESDHEIAHAYRYRVDRGIHPSHSDRGEENGEYAVEHDHQEDRFDHRGGGLLAERFGAAFDPQTLAAGDDTDHQRHERRLDHADLEMRHRDRLAQARDVDFRAHSAVEPGHQPAAIERRHRAEEGQDRQCDDQREHARHDQHLDRVEPHGAQGVDFLAHLHRAELGRVGAAGPARDHDRDDQHAELAQHQDADHVDHIGIGAEFAEMEESLLRDDAADQEGDQQDDGHGLPAD